MMGSPDASMTVPWMVFPFRSVVFSFFPTVMVLLLRTNDSPVCRESSLRMSSSEAFLNFRATS